MVSYLNKRERIIWISLLFVILVIAVLVVSKYQKNLITVNQIVTDLEREKTTWAQTEENLTLEIADIKAQMDNNAEIIKTFPTNDPEIVKELERKGIKGGSNQIINDLLKHNELIPFEGILGGKMAFRKDKIFVISDRWVLAYFEDGHISGNMLLRYNVKNGVIIWKVIDSYVFGQ